MADEIKLVQGDNRPYIKLTLTQVDGTPLDLSDAGISISIHFRSVNVEIPAVTILASKLDGGVNGEVMFNFPGTTLNVEPGHYEGEVEVDFGGETQTIFNRLKFFVREQLS